jgi:hypothetical protein
MGNSIQYKSVIATIRRDDYTPKPSKRSRPVDPTATSPGALEQREARGEQRDMERRAAIDRRRQKFMRAQIHWGYLDIR